MLGYTLANPLAYLVGMSHDVLMKRIQTWIEDLEARGRLFFKKEQALEVLGISENAFHLQMNRFHPKKRVVRVGSGLYAIVPFQFRHQGCIPVNWLIDPYFQHLAKDYYVGLLSAASFYGATHQSPMIFQVMADEHRRRLRLPNLHVYFYGQRYMNEAHTSHIQVPTGRLRISTPAQTMVDVVRFYKSCGYMDNVALVIRELMEDVRPKDLEKVLPLSETSPLQRLGYILDVLERDKLSSCVDRFLNKERHKARTFLKPDVDVKTGRFARDRLYNQKWKLVINDPLDVSSYA